VAGSIHQIANFEEHGVAQAGVFEWKRREWEGLPMENGLRQAPQHERGWARPALLPEEILLLIRVRYDHSEFAD
jgi:hypothetical protein